MPGCFLPYGSLIYPRTSSIVPANSHKNLNNYGTNATLSPDERKKTVYRREIPVTLFFGDSLPVSRSVTPVMHRGHSENAGIKTRYGRFV
jgi:hypothetical protein